MSDDNKKMDGRPGFQPDSQFVAQDREATNTAASKPASPDAGMDQLRDLVLGPMVDDLQTKMTQMGQRLDGSMLELDRRTSDHVAELETRYKERLDTMADEITTLRERQSALLKDVESGSQSLGEKLDELAAKIAKERAADIQSIRSEFEQLSNSIAGRLECETDVLRTELVDRDSLSNALSEIALQLSSGSEVMVTDTIETEMDLAAAIDAASAKENGTANKV